MSGGVLEVMDRAEEMLRLAHVSYEGTIPLRQARSTVAKLIAYAECEEAHRLSLLPTDKGGTGDGSSYLETFRRHGFSGRDVYGFLDDMRRAALARANGSDGRKG